MSAIGTVRRDDGFMLESWLKNVGTLGTTKEEAGSCFFNFHSISQSVSPILPFLCMHAHPSTWNNWCRVFRRYDGPREYLTALIYWVLIFLFSHSQTSSSSGYGYGLPYLIIH